MRTFWSEPLDSTNHRRASPCGPRPLGENLDLYSHRAACHSMAGDQEAALKDANSPGPAHGPRARHPSHPHRGNCPVVRGGFCVVRVQPLVKSSPKCFEEYHFDYPNIRAVAWPEKRSLHTRIKHQGMSWRMSAVSQRFGFMSLCEMIKSPSRKTAGTHRKITPKTKAVVFSIVRFSWLWGFDIRFTVFFCASGFSSASGPVFSEFQWLFHLPLHSFGNPVLGRLTVASLFILPHPPTGSAPSASSWTRPSRKATASCVGLTSQYYISVATGESSQASLRELCTKRLVRIRGALRLSFIAHPRPSMISNCIPCAPFSQVYR